MYFHIKPLEPMSSLWSYYADAPGLEEVKRLYNDKWFGYEVSEIEEVKIDFGGMYNHDEPYVCLKDGEIRYKLKATHLNNLIYALKNNKDEHKNRGVCVLYMKWWRVCIGLEIANKLLLDALQLEKNCQEMIEGSQRSFDDKVAALMNKKSS
jgi:hypothetical protein